MRFFKVLVEVNEVFKVLVEVNEVFQGFSGSLDTKREYLSPQTVHQQLARQMVEEVGSGELEQSKVRELRGQLGKVVEDINDLLTELRYEAWGDGEGA
ncbi:hypothetical protein E2C01_089607 [Portunus trituberculatus]|uniref:Uncharacterized protein n=1 Tax=Portunus trituberculatus TaxID=210409 RepID=A0A5B7JMV2_PORTR|nr:hypothetical protein [Portunus trituberculatus]